MDFLRHTYLRPRKPIGFWALEKAEAETQCVFILIFFSIGYRS